MGLNCPLLMVRQRQHPSASECQQAKPLLHNFGPSMLKSLKLTEGNDAGDTGMVGETVNQVLRPERQQAVAAGRERGVLGRVCVQRQRRHCCRAANGVACGSRSITLFILRKQPRGPTKVIQTHSLL